MRKRLPVTIFCLMLLFFCCGSWIYSGGCALCSSHPYHAPCIIGLSTGNIIPLTVYDPHPLTAGELAEEQSTGYCTIFHCPGLSVCRDTNTRTTSGKLQTADSAPLRRAFCRSCRKALAPFSQTGFVLADLQDISDPRFFSLEEAARFAFRCYEITVTLDSADGPCWISVQGTLE